MKKLLLLILCGALFGCSNSYEAKKALSAMGFTEIRTDGYKWFACSDDDFYHTKFTAKNPSGQVVSGVVCTGFFFKSSTVRF